MVVNHLHIQCILALPSKNNTPLVIDPQTPESGPIAFQFLQPVTRWNASHIQCRRRIDLVEQPPRLIVQFTGQFPCLPTINTVIDISSRLIGEAFQHIERIYRLSIYSSTNESIADDGGKVDSWRSNPSG